MEDNVLLPALLGIALLGFIFITIVCFVARHRRHRRRSSFLKVLRKRTTNQQVNALKTNRKNYSNKI